MKDADDCARYLAALRDDAERERFRAGVADFLARHKEEFATGTLRGILADAYFIAAPADLAGYGRIRNG